MAFSVSYVYQVLDRYTPGLNKIARATERMRQRVERTQKAMGRMSAGMK